MVACAKVLADEGGYCHGEGHYRNENEAFDFGIGTAARHCNIAEGIDIGLNDHVCDGDDGVVDSGRDSLMKDFLKPCEIETDFA